MKLIDGEGLKGRIDDCFGGGSDIALLIHKQIDEFQVPIKPPEEVERVIKSLEEASGSAPLAMDQKDVANLVRLLFGIPQDTWKDEDFNEP